MSGVKRSKDIIDEMLDPGDDPLGWCLAAVVVAAIGLCVLIA